MSVLLGLCVYFPRMSSLGLLSQTSIRYLSSLPYAVFKVRFDRYSDQSPDSSSLFLRNLIADLSAFFSFNPGSLLSSHTVSSAVLSAAQVLTIVFGMGTGVTPERIVTKNGEYEIRTRDLLLARQALSHLS